MTGYGQLWIQPSEGTLANTGGKDPSGISAGTHYNVIPKAGVTDGGIPAVAGVSDCGNLISQSPPTLLQQYELTSLAIWAGFYLHAGGATAPASGIANLDLLVNGNVRYTTQTTPQWQAGVTANDYVSNFGFVGDLVNPILLQARDRLSLRIGWVCTVTVPGLSFVLAAVGAQWDASQGYTSLTAYGVESTISYNVVSLPAARRL